VNWLHLRTSRTAAQTADVQAADKTRFFPRCSKSAQRAQTGLAAQICDNRQIGHRSLADRRRTYDR